MGTGLKKPVWLDKKLYFRDLQSTQEKLSGLNLHTVCVQARCPNISECFKRNTATFLILGDTCTRSCIFCNVKKGCPGAVDMDEPETVRNAVEKLGLKYVVITSVTRDDLKDCGAFIFAETVRKVKNISYGPKVEVLVPDFMGLKPAIDAVLDAGPDVFGHNIETVPSLYNIRKGADYSRSLGVLQYAAGKGAVTKSAILFGLGETRDEALVTMKDIRETGCSYLSIGQYLQPDAAHYPVREYIRPEIFDEYKKAALDMGFTHVESGPYMRSSYLAENYNLNSKL
jgi:lipoyl synthase